MDFSIFSGRDAIILALAVVAIYLLVSLARLGLMKLRQVRANRPHRPAVTQNENIENVGHLETREFQQQDVSFVRELAASQAHQAQSQSAYSAHSQFNEHVFRSGVEAELQALRTEVATLRDAVAQLKATRTVSPQYNEAMLLARRGMNAQLIADQCAISLGEAELVVALNRNEQEHETHDSPY